MTLLNMHIDETVQKKAEAACAAMGLTMSAAINIFLTKVANERRIPFEVSADPDSFQNAKMTNYASLSIKAQKAYDKFEGKYCKIFERYAKDGIEYFYVSDCCLADHSLSFDQIEETLELLADEPADSPIHEYFCTQPEPEEV